MSDSEEENVSLAAASPSDSAGDSDETPGATILRFGNKHYGQRLDVVVKEDIGYVEWCRHPDRKHCKWYDEFCGIYQKYEEWLEKNEGPINPGNTVVWFGKFYRGNTFATMYSAPEHIRFLLDTEDNKRRNWYYWLERQVQKMDEWREAHRRTYRARGPSTKIRDVGDRLTRRDEGVIDPNEEYEKDGFVVSDEEEEEAGSSADVTAGGHSVAQSQAVSQVESPSHASSQVEEVRTQTTESDSSDEDRSDTESSTSSNGDDGWISPDTHEPDGDADYHEDDNDFEPLTALFEASQVSSENDEYNDGPSASSRMQTRSMAAQRKRVEPTEYGDEENLQVASKSELMLSNVYGLYPHPRMLLTSAKASDPDTAANNASLSSPRTKRKSINADLSDEEEGSFRRLRKRLHIAPVSPLYIMKGIC
ncbi:hypothetical protein PENSPDRAFT_176124 [Peniophora sp. CONT]|nr:hypothetical protein PENSPDRAFT_176124 [Peniophora sp. CONT]